MAKSPSKTKRTGKQFIEWDEPQRTAFERAVEDRQFQIAQIMGHQEQISAKQLFDSLDPDTLQRLFNFDVEKKPICECGAEELELPGHTTKCPKYTKW